VGTRSSGSVCAAITARSALAPTWLLLRASPVWRSSLRRGCWIGRPAPEWSWASLRWRFWRSRSCIGCWRIRDSGKPTRMTHVSSRRLAMRTALQPNTVVKPPLQLSMELELLELSGTSAAERRAMIQHLAQLILEAAGVENEETGDDER